MKKRNPVDILLDVTGCHTDGSLADKLGLSRQAISQARSRYYISTRMRNKIAENLGMEVGEIDNWLTQAKSEPQCETQPAQDTLALTLAAELSRLLAWNRELIDENNQLKAKLEKLRKEGPKQQEKGA